MSCLLGRINTEGCWAWRRFWKQRGGGLRHPNMHRLALFHQCNYPKLLAAKAQCGFIAFPSSPGEREGEFNHPDGNPGRSQI